MANMEYMNKYEKENIRQIRLKINRKTEPDLVEWIEKQENIQGYIKGLIKKDMREEYEMEAMEIIENGLYSAAVELMDDEIREDVHADLAPCGDLEFLEEYMSRHERKYGEPFKVN